MELSKISALLAVILLSLCLSLSVCTVIALRSAVTEADRVRVDAEVFLEKLQDVTLDHSTEAPTLPTDAPVYPFCLRETEGRIAVYTADGALIQVTDYSAALLPAADRAALGEGIYASTWQDVMKLLQDFG